MLLDCAKGVEAQTKKLFRVCQQRKIPIFTFVNKMDRPGRDPFDLVGEVENVLGIGVYPDHLAHLPRATPSAASTTGSSSACTSSTPSTRSRAPRTAPRSRPSP